MRTPLEVLTEIFKFENFRADQEYVIDAALKKKHTLVLMPTGMGKSLCFQIPAKLHRLIHGGLTLVVSPLIALMKNQADQAREKGFACCEINSSLSRDEREKRYRKLKNKEYELVYVTPERFRNEEFLEALKQNEVSLFAIDEAHCISEWGHDFRPDYTRLGEIRKQIGNPTVMALTATATLDVQKDIMKQLGFAENEMTLFNSGLMRDNLSLTVHDIYGLEQKVQKFNTLHQFWEGNAIVYFSLISTLEKFSQELSKLNIEHAVYHGQLPKNQRKREQDNFLSGASKLILATPAFGLGINKSDVRLLIHAEIPGSLEAYYQEVGRAGRDGLKSQCHLLYDEDDVSIQMDFIKWANPEPEFILSMFKIIEQNVDLVNQMGADFLRDKMNFYNSKDFRVETALNQLERWGFLEGNVEDRNLKVSLRPTDKITHDLFDLEVHKKRLKHAQTKLLKMVQYTKDQQCRLRTIYAYFGLETKNCGHCDHCLKNERFDTEVF